MEYIEILFENLSDNEKELLIALLADIGFEGFEEENNMFKAFIPFREFEENLLTKIVEIKNIKYSKSIIKSQNWNELWESDFQPVLINFPETVIPFVKILAHFHKTDPSFLFNISITPKMSFGTGHHETTHLMVAHMSEIDFKEKSVIDFGTGTGILAILAEKLGASHIVAIDNDEWSIKNASENIDVNNCTNIFLQHTETISSNLKAQIILANINLNTIRQNINAIINAADTNSILLFSGIMLHDEEKILQVLQTADLKVKAIYKKGNWLLILATKS